MLSHCDTCTTPYPADLDVCPNCGTVARHANDTPIEGCPHCEEAVMAKNTVHGGPTNALVEPNPDPAEVVDPAAAPLVGEDGVEKVELPADTIVTPPAPPAPTGKAGKK